MYQSLGACLKSQLRKQMQVISISSRPASSMEWIPEQIGLQSESLSQKQTKHQIQWNRHTKSPWRPVIQNILPIEEEIFKVKGQSRELAGFTAPPPPRKNEITCYFKNQRTSQATKWVLRQPKLHREVLSQNRKSNTQTSGKHLNRHFLQPFKRLVRGPEG